MTDLTSCNDVSAGAFHQHGNNVMEGFVSRSVGLIANFDSSQPLDPRDALHVERESIFGPQIFSVLTISHQDFVV